MRANILLMEKKQIRERIKEQIKKLAYQEAYKTAIENSDNEKIKNKLQEGEKELNVLYQKLKNKSISNEDFYYGINNLISELLDCVDEIVGEPDNDWEFVDDLASSLKFNLAEQSEKIFGNQNIVFADNKGNVVFDFESEEDNDQEIEKIKKLHMQLNYYENLQRKAKDPEEKAKIHSIIKAINQRISETGGTKNI